MMKKRHILHWAMGVVMTTLLGSCAADEIVGGAGSGNGVLSFGVEVNAGAPEVKPMGGATRSGDRADSRATGGAVMSPDVEGFFPTSSVELSSVDGNAIYANCDERSGINMHNNVDYKATRGSIQTTANFYTSFALYGYVYDSGKTWASDKSTISVDTKITGITMTKNGSGTDYNASDVFWPGASKKATFFAVAPKDCPGASITAAQGDPTITYTVPQTVSAQEDLLVAKSNEDIKCDGKNAPNPLTFNHALAAIKFEKGTLPDGLDVNNVEISGVFNKGELSSFESPEWSNLSIDGSGTNTYTITDLNNVMFLMPQTFTDDAQIKLTLSDYTYYIAKLKDGTNTSWQAGHQYTYKLSVNKVTGTFKFEVTANKTSVSKDGESVTFDVKSYFHYNDNTKDVPIAWQAKNSDGSLILSGAGGSTSVTTSEIIIAANTAASSVHKDNLQSVQIGTSTDYYDLSYDYDSKKRWTANCYVVNGWGYFKLPLVYGNAIKNGTTNSDAYKAAVDPSAYCTAKDFCNRDGNAINNPMIIALSGTISTATVEWQYVNNLETTTMVKNAKVDTESDGYTYLYFEIDKGKIDQGNALISVSDNGGILWSWHIWVTDMPWKTTNKYTNGSYSYSFMTMPLGMVDLTAATPRKLDYTFSQTPSNGKSVVVSINQAGDSYPTNTTCTIYQWGRKDPFMLTSNPTSPGGQTYATAIKYPTVFYKGAPYDWSIGRSCQLWNAGNTTMNENYRSIKTIYDPCPPGFKVAPQQAYRIMVENCGGFNWDPSASGSKCSNTSDFWHAFGIFDNEEGSLMKAGLDGYYWSAGPFSDISGYDLHFNSRNSWSQGNSDRASGLSVRPVSEN